MCVLGLMFHGVGARRKRLHGGGKFTLALVAGKKSDQGGGEKERTSKFVIHHMLTGGGIPESASKRKIEETCD